MFGLQMGWLSMLTQAKNSSSLQPHLGVVLKDVVRERSPNGKSFSSTRGHPSVCKNEWLNVRLYMKSQAIVIDHLLS